MLEIGGLHTGYGDVAVLHGIDLTTPGSGGRNLHAREIRLPRTARATEGPNLDRGYYRNQQTAPHATPHNFVTVHKA